MRVHAELRRALSTTVRAARRSLQARHRGEVEVPIVIPMVADLDDVECASLVASSTAWRQRRRGTWLPT